MEFENSKYENYTTEEFLTDEFFLAWVKGNSQESQTFWEDWLSLHPDKSNKIQEAKSIIESAQYMKSEKLSNKEELELYEGIIKGKRKQENKVSYSLSFKYVYRVAAVITTLIIASTGYYQFYIKSKNERIDVNKVEWLSSNNPKGMKSTLSLSDGTIIRLNAESRLHYPANFSGNERKVFLVGEAFFDVAENPEMPFTIETGEITTRVLGTSFNIKTGIQHNKVQVTVVSGQVQVKEKSSNNEVGLGPYEELVYNSEEKDLKKHKVHNLDEVIGWKEGILVFNSSSFDDVCKKIEKWYGVEITLQNNFETPVTYTGSYNNKTLKKVMEGISYALGLEYELKGKKLFIQNKR